MAKAYALAGNKVESVKTFERLRKSSPDPLVSPWDLSLVCIGLGEKTQALALLQKASDAHIGWVIRLGVDPTFDSLRTEPQFRELVRQIGIPQH